MNFKCNQCDTQFSCQYEFIMHRSSHTILTKENKENVVCYCQLCEVICINQDHLQNHVAQHMTEQKYVCGQCNTKFKLESRYFHHIRFVDCIVRSNDSNKCPLCSKILSNKNHLKNHIRLLHTQETKFHCATCNKPFLRKDKLDVHAQSHSTEFCCKICQVKFKSKLVLNRHHQSVHISSFSATYQCSECPKKYFKEARLLSHARLLNPNLSHEEIYKCRCNECEKSFRRNGNLIFHQRSHSKIRL